jgi:GWxTD domain-containing protein
MPTRSSGHTTLSGARLRRRILTLAGLLSLLCLVPLSATPNAKALPDLFRKAKEEVKLGSFDAALSTLQEIETASQQPGLEKDRQALEPSLAFYKGVCHAALGKADEARVEFAAFLKSSPNAKLDPAMYPKRVIAAFEEVQKSLGGPQPEDPRVGIAPAYRGFKTPDSAEHAVVPENWADGPVRFLLTSNEAEEFRHLVDPVARSEFITKFWKARDPKPETPENEFRDEFERRVAFADRYFVQGETRGSYTDRGTVFVLLGPPAYSMQRPMKTGDDTADPTALFLSTPGQVQEASIGGKNNGSRTAQIARIDAAAGPGTSMISASTNWREVWRYMRKDLPGKLPYEWVDFDFISKPGYGEGVMQRTPEALQTLDRAKASLPRS